MSFGLAVPKKIWMQHWEREKEAIGPAIDVRLRATINLNLSSSVSAQCVRHRRYQLGLESFSFQEIVILRVEFVRMPTPKLKTSSTG